MENPGAIIKIAQEHQSVIQELSYKEKNLRLDRLDLQLGLSSSGELGILTFGASSAVELIWMRPKELDSDDIDDEREIILDTNSTPKNLFNDLRKEIDRFIDLKILNKKSQNRILRTLRKDAEEITSVVSSLVHMPSLYGWYIDGFFKNYAFSVSGKLLGILSAGYDKRIRFRFKVRRAPYRDQELDELNQKQLKLKNLMSQFSLIAQRQNLRDTFKLKRVWTINSIEKDLDLVVANLGISKGIQIEFKKQEDYFQDQTLKPKWIISEKINNKVISSFNRFDISTSPYELNLRQVRLKYTTETGLDFKLASINKPSTVEFHYKR